MKLILHLFVQVLWRDKKNLQSKKVELGSFEWRGYLAIASGVYTDLATPVNKWSWRDSNPRPDKALISFLHAYSIFWVSVMG